MRLVWPVFREVTTGKLMRLPVRASGVQSNLMAPFDLTQLGIRIVLDADDSHLLDKNTNQRINLKWRGGMPVMRVEVLEPTGDDREINGINDVEKPDEPMRGVPNRDTPGASSSTSPTLAKPFQRQAPLKP